MNRKKTVTPDLVVLLGLLFFLLFSCNETGETGNDPADGMTYNNNLTGLSALNGENIQADIEKTYHQRNAVLTYKLLRSRITTSEKTFLLLRVSTRENIAVQFPQFTERLGKFRVNGVSPTRKERSDAENVITAVTLSLEPSLEGSYTVPSFTITLEDRETGEETIFLTDEESVTVLPLLTEHEAAAVENTGKAAIKDIIVPESQNAAVFVVAGIAAVMIGFAAAVLIYIKRKKQAKTMSGTISQTEQLDRELQRLLDKKLPEKGRHMEYFIQLSYILRRHIEKQSGIRATEQTTEEFLKNFTSHTEYGEKDKLRIQEFLTLSDAVKFGARLPSLEETERAADICRRTLYSNQSAAAGSTE